MSDEGPLGFEPESDEERAERRRRHAHREDPDLRAERLDAPGARFPAPTPRLPAGASRYGWFVGLVGGLIVVLITLNTFRSHGVGSTGIKAGGLAPPFAAPLATSTFPKDADVDVARKAKSGDLGKVAACDVREAGVLNACTLWEKGPLVLAFFATRSSRCIRELDTLDDVARRHPDVAFGAISIRGKKSDAAKLQRDRRWSFPVAYDHDGVLANLYGVAVCPQIAFLRRGGRVAYTAVGSLGAAGIDAQVRRLER